MMSGRKFLVGQEEEILDEESMKKIRTHFPFYGDVIRLQPDGWFFIREIGSILDKIFLFKFQSSDVVTASFPKSGTTWLQEIVWNLMKNPSGDNPEAAVNIDVRSPFMEGDLMFLAKKNPMKLALSQDDNMKAIVEAAKGLGHPELLLFTHAVVAPNPRVLKTHLPFSLFNQDALKTPKIVYVARDPRDVIVSRYHFMRLLKAHSFQGSFEDFIDFFINEEMFYNPYWLHLRQAWDRRDDPNFHFVYYEDLVSNIFAEVKKIDKFLGTNRTDDQIKQVISFTNFKNMKERAEKSKDEIGIEIFFDKEVKETSGGFYRKGKVGDWKSKFTPGQVIKIENWIKKNEFCPDFRYNV